MESLPARGCLTSVSDRRIALLVTEAGGGGAERVTAYLASGLADRGYAVDFVALTAKGPYLAGLSARVNVVDLGVAKMRHAILPLIEYLRNRRPALLIPASDHVNVGALVASLVARTRTRVIPTIHSPHSMAQSFSGSLKGRVLHALVKRLYRRAAAVVAVSRGAADDMIRHSNVPRELVRVIYPILTPGIDAMAAEPVDHPWFAVGQPPVILGVGRLSPQKDFSTLLRAFALVRRDLHVRLMILGEGGERERLEQEIRSLGLADDVTLPGFVSNVFAYQARCAVFVLSSAWEAMPMVITEALATKAPVVATACPTGPDEILADGKYGRLVPVGDAETMAVAIQATLSEARRPVPAAAIRPFEMDSVLDEYERLFREIADE